MPKFKVTCWPGSGLTPVALTADQIKLAFPEKFRIIEAKDSHQAATMHLCNGCTSDGCLSEPYEPD